MRQRLLRKTPEGKRILKTIAEAKQELRGQYVYAYCNPSTKQVLYSLTRALQDEDLKQLPDIGANHSPPKLRKDSWRPLWCLELPDTPDGRKQGEHAFKLLREFRMLHETNWEPPLELSMRTTEAKKKELQERLDKRGGSKKEGVHDLIKRNKKKLRKAIIMNQKANSVADLAAVLFQQEEQGHNLQLQRHKHRRQRVTEMLKMAEEAKGDTIQTLEEEIASLRKQIDDGSLAGKILATKRHITEMQLHIARIRFSAAAVAWAQMSEAQREEEVKAWQGVSDMKMGSPSGSLTEITIQNATEEELQTMTEADQRYIRFVRTKQFLRQQLADGNDWPQIAVVAKAQDIQIPQLSTEAQEAAPVSVETSEDSPSDQAETLAADKQSEDVPGTDPAPEASETKPPSINPDDIFDFPPELDPLHISNLSNKKVDRSVAEKIKQHNRPIFTVSNVKVHWSDIFDAEYAEFWPEEVIHEHMGRVRNVHPQLRTHPKIEELRRQRKAEETQRIEAKKVDSYTMQKVEEIRARMGLGKNGEPLQLMAPVDASGEMEEEGVVDPALIPETNAGRPEVRA